MWKWSFLTCFPLKSDYQATYNSEISSLPKVQLLEFIAGTADLTTENNSTNSAVSTPKRKINHDKEEVRLVSSILFSKCYKISYER